MTIEEANQAIRAGRGGKKPAARQTSTFPALLASMRERVTAMKAQTRGANRW
jgi:hypothetical protein